MRKNSAKFWFNLWSIIWAESTRSVKRNWRKMSMTIWPWQSFKVWVFSCCGLLWKSLYSRVFVYRIKSLKSALKITRDSIFSSRSWWEWSSQLIWPTTVGSWIALICWNWSWDIRIFRIIVSSRSRRRHSVSFFFERTSDWILISNLLI